MSTLRKALIFPIVMSQKINKLSDIEFKNPFTVPDNYFENISEEIMKNLPEKETPLPVKVSMWTKVKPWIYMAAMFVGTYFLVQVLLDKTGGTDGNLNRISSHQNVISSDKYWSDVQITEDEFFEYVEDQLINDGYYDYMYNQYYLN